MCLVLALALARLFWRYQIGSQQWNEWVGRDAIETAGHFSGCFVLFISLSFSLSLFLSLSLVRLFLFGISLHAGLSFPFLSLFCCCAIPSACVLTCFDCCWLFTGLLAARLCFSSPLVYTLDCCCFIFYSVCFPSLPASLFSGVNTLLATFVDAFGEWENPQRQNLCWIWPPPAQQIGKQRASVCSFVFVCLCVCPSDKICTDGSRRLDSADFLLTEFDLLRFSCYNVTTSLTFPVQKHFKWNKRRQRRRREHFNYPKIDFLIVFVPEMVHFWVLSVYIGLLLIVVVVHFAAAF